MVVLTLGMYGCSMTESRDAMLTDTPITVPARFLGRGKNLNEQQSAA